MSENLEIERKFLLKTLPIEIIHDDRIEIVQHYFKTKNKWERIRRSITNDNVIYHHTIKNSISKGVCEEIEKEINDIEYQFYLNKCSKMINKTRFIYNIDNNLKWEVDKYTHINLIVAEIEIPDINHKVKLPNWIKDRLIMEVTGIKEFSNRSLADKIEI